KDSLVILNLETANRFTAPNVTSYKLPQEAGEYVAYISEHQPEKSDDTLTKKPVSVLHIRHLPSGEESTFDRVETYEFSKQGNALAFVRETGEQDTIGAATGMYYYDLANRTAHPISSGKGKYKNIAFDESGSQLAFTADKSPKKSIKEAFKLYYYETEHADTAREIANAHLPGMPHNWSISGNGTVRFSKNGEKLFFGIAPIPPVKDTSLVEFEHANVDIWHWQDDYLQPQQLVNLAREQKRSYLAVIHLKNGPRVLALANENLPDVRLTQDADNEYALGITDVGRRIETQWRTGAFQEIFAVSTVDGSRKRVASDVRGPISL